jgi:DNA replication and repair protein RecF
MYLKSLELKNFRNYTDLNLTLNKGLNIFVGENAQGKTNIVESIYYISSMRSHRTTKDKELIKWGKVRAYIKGEVVKVYGESVMEFLISSEEKKAVKVNGVKVTKTAEVLGNVNAVIFSPEDLKLVKEGPALRRRFIDNELNQIRPKYHYALSRYNHCLMQRNNLLKSARGSEAARATIDVFSEQLADYGSFITEVRQEFIKKLALIAKLMHRKITDGREELEVAYIQSFSDFKDRNDLKNKLLKYYLENLKDDINRRVTLVGPHRDDLLININGTDARVYGSQGQQRTAALSLKLSELEIIKSEVGEYPILLLDDVLSELDTKRQSFLLSALKDIQTIVTCTSLNDINAFHFEEKDVFEVNKGIVAKKQNKG